MKKKPSVPDRRTDKMREYKYKYTKSSKLHVIQTDDQSKGEQVASFYHLCTKISYETSKSANYVYKRQHLYELNGSSNYTTISVTDWVPKFLTSNIHSMLWSNDSFKCQWECFSCWLAPCHEETQYCHHTQKCWCVPIAKDFYLSLLIWFCLQRI